MTICAEHFSFRYRKDGPWVLKDLTFEVSFGDTIAIVGASGCGKSTLLRILSGVLPVGINNQSSGKITIDGSLPREYRTKSRIAFIFQEPTLLPHLTVQENVTFPLEFAAGGDGLREKVNGVIRDVGIEPFRDSYPRVLSGGTKARVALAQSFALQPSLLLLDEPFSSLDVGWKHQLYLQLEQLKDKSNATVFLVTHDLDEAVSLADRLFVISTDGSLHRDYSLRPSEERTPITVSMIVSDILVGHPASGK
jgi:NitT/TauT family transport system ATP-binding protein